jgi:hypothetical protein
LYSSLKALIGTLNWPRLSPQLSSLMPTHNWQEPGVGRVVFWSPSPVREQDSHVMRWPVRAARPV